MQYTRYLRAWVFVLTPYIFFFCRTNLATSKRSGSHPPSYIGGRRWSLRQAGRRLLDKSSTGEDDEEEEDFSAGERDIIHRDERGLPGTRGSRPSGSTWVACSLRQSDIYQLVEEFGILPEFVVSVPPPDNHLSSPPLGYMSFFASQIRASLRFPLPSFFCDISSEFQVPLNQLAPNSIRILVAFSVVFQYNNLIPTFRVFSQYFQLKRAEPGVFHFAPRCGVSFLPTPSPHKRWKDKLNEKSYDCKELTEERLMSHFGLSPRVVPLQEPLAISYSANTLEMNTRLPPLLQLPVVIAVGLVMILQWCLKGRKGSEIPGKLGLPFLGETFAFLAAVNSTRGCYDFVRLRRLRYGKWFKTRILGKTHVYVPSVEGAKTVFANDFVLFNKRYLKSMGTWWGRKAYSVFLKRYMEG
ncbi:Taxoid 7-beta-hydroxylase [Sesamum angolense]|uniref:Taxoid 7-beta-hydroxylase n=1 Tax=Sesamum angolense TaxID=2727404 RepID=A0AAE1WJ71_9LAMI|nr:Taxoid 7-beta-hydroxylase [Sesamum angolense]